MSCDRFDLEEVKVTFQNALKDEDDVLMDEYLKGFNEITKFFQLMGTVFGFVSNDVRNKIDILETFRKTELREHFSTFKTMMEYEKTNGLLNDGKYLSGSRTLLRLHRGLEFLHEFLLQLADLSIDDKASTCCQKAYIETLAKHHPWVIRKGANVAMYALPTQGELLKRVCADVEGAIKALPEMLKATKIIHERTEKLYSLYGLHELP